MTFFLKVSPVLRCPEYLVSKGLRMHGNHFVSNHSHAQLCRLFSVRTGGEETSARMINVCRDQVLYAVIHPLTLSQSSERLVHLQTAVCLIFLSFNNSMSESALDQLHYIYKIRFRES
jgi:hypothetical protein